MAMAVGALVAVIMCTISAFCAMAARRIYRLRVHGVRTTGRLVDYRVDTDDDGDEWYFLTIAFTLPDGTEVESESATPVRRLPFGLHRGDSTDVTYDPAAPRHISLTSIETTDRKLGDSLAYAVTSVATLVGAALAVIKSSGS